MMLKHRSESESFPLNFSQNAVLAIPPFYICLTAWTCMALSQPHEFQEIGQDSALTNTYG